MQASGKKFWDNVDSFWPFSIKKLCDVTGLSYQKIRDQRYTARLPALADAYMISTAIGASIEKLLTGMNVSDFPESINEIAEKSLDATDDDLRFIHTILGINDNIYTLHGDFQARN